MKTCWLKSDDEGKYCHREGVESALQPVRVMKLLNDYSYAYEGKGRERGKLLKE